MATFQENLNRYFYAGFPIIYIDTFEEEKVDGIIREVVDRKEIMEWTILGFRPSKKSKIIEWSLLDTLKNLIQFPERCNHKVLVLKDIAISLSEDSEVISFIKRLAINIYSGLLQDFNIIILSNVVVIPEELEKYMTILSMDYLTQDEIIEVVNSFCNKSENKNKVVLDEEFLKNKLSLALKGLSELDIKNILALAVYEGGNINAGNLKLITEQKKQIIRKSGILEMISDNDRDKIENIGGLKILKEWLERKSEVYKNINDAKDFGVDMPKGVLIAGMPGCGKSLTAKATAMLFGVPLLRMDIGRLMGKYVGESEANMRKAIKLAEAISPCVLWIDEIEKAFAGIGGNGGGSDVTTRLFGTFLTWLQEKESMVFVVATANNVSNKLPPELMRKGRFDDIFFVDLPNDEERRNIFKIHIERRRAEELKNKNIDITQLVNPTDGYSGAEIEGVVKTAIEAVFSKNKKNPERSQQTLSTNDILNAIRGTSPLSKIREKDIKAMRDFYIENNFKNASKEE